MESSATLWQAIWAAQTPFDRWWDETGRRAALEACPPELADLLRYVAQAAFTAGQQRED